MYPYLRAARSLSGKKTQLNSIWDTTHLDMRVWPGDIDIFMELNNGRYLTLMDFGRFDFLKRMDWMKLSRSLKWGGAVAGVSIRYRKRLHLWQKFTLSTRLVAVDDRWLYFGHSVERREEMHASALVRFAITDKNGLVPINKIETALGIKIDRKMPGWVREWDHSDQIRPWLPMKDLTDI